MYHIPLYKLSLVRDNTIKADRKVVNACHDVYPILRDYYDRHDREEMLVVLLDAKHKIIGINSVSVGSVTMSLVHPRETFKAAIISNCVAIILAHNHPSGDPTPSQEDHQLTKRLKECGEMIGIPVLDHLVIGDGTYYSFAERGTL